MVTGYTHESTVTYGGLFAHRWPDTQIGLRTGTVTGDGSLHSVGPGSTTSRRDGRLIIMADGSGTAVIGIGVLTDTIAIAAAGGSPRWS